MMMDDEAMKILSSVIASSLTSSSLHCHDDEAMMIRFSDFVTSFIDDDDSKLMTAFITSSVHQIAFIMMMIW